MPANDADKIQSEKNQHSENRSATAVRTPSSEDLSPADYPDQVNHLQKNTSSSITSSLPEDVVEVIRSKTNMNPSSVNDPTNKLFQLAVQFVNQTAKHLFLTGKAGTGKTTFLKYIKENSFKRMAIVAPTGVAAINAGGVTIHSFFQLPFGPFVPTKRSGWNAGDDANQYSLFDETPDADAQHGHSSARNANNDFPDLATRQFFAPKKQQPSFQHPDNSIPSPSFQGRSGNAREITNQHSLFKNIRFNEEKRRLIQELEMIVIDEVSMLRADMLDAIDLILRHFRQQPLVAFGGIQMVFIGDLFQLPPVINNEEWEILKNYYKSPFFFDAHAIEQSPPLYLELKKIYRQNEIGFISILNNIRNNKATQSDLELLHRFYNPAFQPPPEDNYIILTSHNAKADSINRKELEKLNVKLFSFPGTISGDFNEKALPVDKNLQLKVGAQIMFLKNDKGEKRRYYNGKIGQVTRIKDQAIFVNFPGSEEEIEVEKETWRNIRYRFDHEKNKIEEEELGTFTQYPIRLAWAITIHKSQGLTFEKAIIDAGASFAAGQVYVALSRLTSLQGLILHSPIRPDCISTDERVLAFVQNEKDETILRSLFQEEQSLFITRQLIQSFDWTKLLTSIENLLEEYPERMIPLKEPAIEWARGILKETGEQQEVALKFKRQLDQLLSDPGGEDYTQLYKRIVAAEQYFKDRLRQIADSLTSHINEYAPKQRIKKYIHDLEAIQHFFGQKNQELENAVMMAEGLMNGKDMTTFFSSLQKNNIPDDPAAEATPKEEAGNKASSKEKKGATKRISLDLFLEGKTIPEIASARDLVVSTVEGHLASFLATGEVKIEQLVSQAKINAILKLLNESPESSITLIKTKAGETYSYAEIRAVAAYRASGNKKNI